MEPGGAVIHSQVLSRNLALLRGVVAICMLMAQFAALLRLQVRDWHILCHRLGRNQLQGGLHHSLQAATQSGADSPDYAPTLSIHLPAHQ